MSNGYPAGDGATRQARYPSRRPNVVDGPEKIPFCLPYISDDMSRAVRGCLRKAGLRNDVRVVEIPPANLKAMLVRNRVYDRLCTTPSCVVCPYGREGDCMISGVVYRITCRLCGDDYIGETGRPLCIRVKEHLDGLAKSKTFTPLGAHRRICHPNSEVEVEVRILSYESEITARRTLEAFWITAKSPKMNKKDECIAITNELSPYQDLCGCGTWWSAALTSLANEALTKAISPKPQGNQLKLRFNMPRFKDSRKATFSVSYAYYIYMWEMLGYLAGLVLNSFAYIRAIAIISNKIVRDQLKRIRYGLVLGVLSSLLILSILIPCTMVKRKNPEVPEDLMRLVWMSGSHKCSIDFRDEFARRFRVRRLLPRSPTTAFDMVTTVHKAKSSATSVFPA
ncbi:hypothetical protein RB195_008467 [Necator americanus]|uniref:GIY-YIG domain-containing protein n=1 Tax=Necator americanus TaxID=51031 RepID=A0ABR1CNU5_NECAM